MAKKLAYVLGLTTFLVIGWLVFFFDKDMTFSSLWHAIRLAVPASVIVAFCGYYMGKVLSSSKTKASLFASSNQKTYVDDLLITPDELLGKNYSIDDKEYNDEDNLDLQDDNKVK